MDERHPNSKGYWQRNRLSAIEMELPLYPPADPENQKYQTKLLAEYRTLQARESVVISRHDRIRRTKESKNLAAGAPTLPFSQSPGGGGH
jgi:hypothetical protein